MSLAPLPQLEPSRIRALLFDVDGTLSDSDDLLVEHTLSLLKKLGILKNPEKLARNLVFWIEKPGNWLLAMLDQLGLDGVLAKVLDWRDDLASRGGLQLSDYPVIPGVSSMLARLSGQFPMAVVSARNGTTTNNFLRVNGLDQYFKVVIHSQSLRRTKPFPDPLLRAAEVLGVEASECLMIGDTVTDVRAAHAAGTYSLSVLCGFGLESQLRKAGTHAVLMSTADLADYLLSGTASLPPETDKLME